VPIGFASRIFAPRPFTTLLTIALIALLLSLGRWQLRRADEKRALYDAFAAGTDITRVLDSPGISTWQPPANTIPRVKS
jgi:cytochrome oxidase assembly protein ShyY1